MKFRMFPLMEEDGGGGDGGAAAAKAAAAAAKNQPPETFSREYVHELREENKSWRTKHQEEVAARKAADDATKAATKSAEDATAAAEIASAAKIKDANTAADQRIIRAELKAAALKAGMHDLDGLKLADISKVKLNDAGEIEGADKLMEDLKKAKPYLFGTESTSSHHKPPPAGDTKPKSAMEMSKEEYAAARRAVGRRAR